MKCLEWLINLPLSIRDMINLSVLYRQITFTYEVTLISSDHNNRIRNSSVIVDLALGQIPRSTERISNFSVIFVY